MPEESNLNVSQSQLNSDVKRVSDVKSVSGPDQKKVSALYLIYSFITD